MPELTELYNNDQTFGLTSWTSEWLNVSKLIKVNFIVFNDKTYDSGIRWAVDSSYQIIEDDASPTATNDTTYISSFVKARFVQFYINNISVQPSILETQGFFFNE